MNPSVPRIDAPPLPRAAIAPWRVISSPQLSTADRWFAALDQHIVTLGNQRWTTQVVGVHVHPFETWIQLEFNERPERSFLLRLQPSAGLNDALATIRALLQQDGGRMS